MRGILEYYLFEGWKRLSRLELAKILGWVSPSRPMNHSEMIKTISLLLIVCVFGDILD